MPARTPNRIARAVIYVVQGIPLVVLLFIAYFGLTTLGLEVPPLAGAALGLTLFAGAFLGEIWRGAIAAVPDGQWQSAAALGLRWRQAMRLVIAPQATRAAIPPTVGFLVQLVKNTSLASLIGYIEVTRAGQLVSNATFAPLPVFLTVAALYFALCFPLSCVSPDAGGAAVDRPRPRTPHLKELAMHRLIAALAFAACLLTGAARAESALDTVVKRGTLIVGISLGTPPFGITNEKMEPDGYDVGLAKLLARELGVKLQIQDIVASARVPSITAGKVDIVISSFSITPERAKAIAFSNPVFIDQQVMLAPKDKTLATMADMKGKRIGVTRSSTNDIVVTRLAPEGTTIQRFDDDASTNQAMLAGQIDAMVTSGGLARVLSARTPALETKFVVSQAPMAIGLKRDDAEWLHWINTTLFMNWVNREIPTLPGEVVRRRERLAAIVLENAAPGGTHGPEIRHAAAAERGHPRVGKEAGGGPPGAPGGRRRDRRRGRGRDRRCGRGHGHAAPRAARTRPEAPVAASAPGRAAARLLPPGADRPPRGRHQPAGDFQRPYRRAHHGLRPGLRARPGRLHPASAPPRMGAGTARYRRDRPARGDGADRRHGRHRRGSRPPGGGLRHDRPGDGCPPGFGPGLAWPSCTRRTAWTACCRAPTS